MSGVLQSFLISASATLCVDVAHEFASLSLDICTHGVCISNVVAPRIRTVNWFSRTSHTNALEDDGDFGVLVISPNIQVSNHFQFHGCFQSRHARSFLILTDRNLSLTVSNDPFLLALSLGHAVQGVHLPSSGFGGRRLHDASHWNENMNRDLKEAPVIKRLDQIYASISEQSHAISAFSLCRFGPAVC